jgi:hypothetical protein
MKPQIPGLLEHFPFVLPGHGLLPAKYVQPGERVVGKVGADCIVAEADRTLALSDAV